MGSVRRRGLSFLGLGLWMLAAVGGQGLELHVAVDHARHMHPHPHNETAGIVGLLHHHGSEAPADHEHDLSVKVDDPASRSPRVQATLDPLLAILPIPEHPAACLMPDLSAPAPHPRGTPPRTRAFKVLRI